MRYQYYFYEPYKEQIKEYLLNKKINFQENKSDVTGDSIIFSLWSNTENVDMILRDLRVMNVKKPLIFVTYTASDLNNAKMLVMTPKRQYIDIVNTEESYRYSCKWITTTGREKMMHEEQIGAFMIDKEPSSKTSTAFWTENTGFAEIFTDYRVFNLVHEQSLTGIKFESVRNKKGDYSKNIFQMRSTNIIDTKCIDMGHGEEKHICHMCGKEQFYIDNIYQLHIDCSKLELQSDLYMTERIWGEGIAYPLYIISQRFYQLLRKYKLAGGITFSPVIEINEG